MNRRVTFLALAASAALAVSALAACSDLADLGNTPVVSSDAGTQSQSLSGTVCETCIASSCQAQSTACAANSACASYEDCLAPCGSDYACRSRCLVASYASTSEIPAMDQCVSAECASACGLTCEMTTTYAEPDAAASCAQCLSTVACDQAKDCGDDLGCQQRIQCQLGCVTEDCLLACTQEADAGLDTAYLATAVGCGAACGVGEFWDCPTARGVPISTTGGQTVITLIFADFPDQLPVAGATVKACALSDVDCTRPLAQQQTTDAGAVTFTLGEAGISFSGYFDVSLPSTLYPSLFFLPAPLSVPRVTYPAVLVPQSSFIQDAYTSMGVTPDPSLGIVEIQAEDCHFMPASRVTAQLISPDGGVGADFAYFLNNQLAPAATSTGSGGYAMLLDAPVGTPLVISATPLAVGHSVADVSLFTRPGTWSFELARPM